jgi:hypothetical protein
MKAFLATLLVGFVAADGVTLQLFDGPSCNQNSQAPDKVVANVNTNSGNQNDGSGCVAANFVSAKIINFQNGFKCNIYSDSGCQNFVQSITAPDGCDAIPGSSALCFNQALFDNPLAESKASITVGSQDMPVAPNTPILVADAVALACGDTGCDPTHKQTFPFNHFNKNGMGTVTMTGSYSDTNQREYMKNLLVQVVSDAAHNTRVDTTGSSEDDDIVTDQFTFFQVVIRDENGNIQCQMTVSFDVAVESPKQGDCGILGDAEKLALGAIPGVGGILATSFDFVCQHSG